MKTIYYLLLLSIFAIACGDDKEENPTPVVEDTAVYFKCKLNGVNYVDDARFADYLFGSSRIVSQNNEELLKLEMSTDTIGAFEIGPLNLLNNIVYVDSLDRIYNAINGTITITEASKTKQIISGTFTGEMVNENDATDKIKITEGKFNRIKFEPF